MDPVSQGAIGATFAVATIRRKKVASIALIGAVAGLAPDVDVFFQSASDPLLFLEYHRQFYSLVDLYPIWCLDCCLVGEIFAQARSRLANDLFKCTGGLRNSWIVRLIHFLWYPVVLAIQ